MKNLFLASLAFLFAFAACAQNTMTPELLWQLGRVSPVGLAKDGEHLVYKVTTPSVADNNFSSVYYSVSLEGGKPVPVDDPAALVMDPKLSPDGTYVLFHEAVKEEKVTGADHYPELTESEAHIYTDLDYRIWDTWNDGTYHHVHYRKVGEKSGSDIMDGEPYNTPTKPFGGPDEYVWTPDSKGIVYVCKKKSGADAVTSTNTDLYHYDLTSGKTKNITPENPGYNKHPSYSSKGKLAWLSMARDGYESDKNDIIVDNDGVHKNLTKAWDGTVRNFIWGKDGKTLYFTAAVDGTIQLFAVQDPGLTKKLPLVKQLTEGPFDVNGPIAHVDNKLVVTRSDMNHANELFAYDLKKKSWTQLSHANDAVYAKLNKSKVERRMVKTTDGADMLTWVIYPPNFDPNKKYPTLLYCQGGPQSALSQFYSFRWNFQIMAAQGYIIVAPNRRGMPGHGVAWNEAISKDWGGKAMQDYLDAIDAVAQEPYVDNDRLGAIGASFGGYSVFYLAGHHDGRFKTFIAHDGVFNLRSMYGTTEELFFVNWDIGGPYWDTQNKAAQRSYSAFNPIDYVAQWDTPIMIIQGGRDYRVPIGQGLEAFTAARTRGIESKLLYFPEENHWVLNPQNGIVWQREFFDWLKKTL